MTNSDTPPITSPCYNVEPTSHTSKPQIFNSLSYTIVNLKFINNFNFHLSDLTDTEYITLCNLLLQYKTCYATHKNDVGKIATTFRIRLKSNAQLVTQRPLFNTLLKKLEVHNDEFPIIGSPHPIHVFTDNKPLLHSFSKKRLA